jgi:toxin YoeB
MTTISATEARKQLYKLLDDVSLSHEPVQITGKRSNAILVSEDDWRAVQETLFLVSIPGMRESILEGMMTPTEELARLVNWRLLYTKQARKDAKKLAAAGLKLKAQEILAILEVDPFQSPPPFEKLVGDLSGAFSRRINIQHRLVYQVLEDERIVKVLRMWTHFE